MLARGALVGCACVQRLLYELRARGARGAAPIIQQLHGVCTQKSTQAPHMRLAPTAVQNAWCRCMWCVLPAWDRGAPLYVRMQGCNQHVEACAAQGAAPKLCARTERSELLRLLYSCLQAGIPANQTIRCCTCL